MAVHQIYITREEFKPSSLTIKSGDQVVFRLSDRNGDTQVWVASGEPLDGEAKFMVGPNGKQKTVISSAEKTYQIRAMMMVPPDEERVHEQPGTMGGKIIVMP